MNTPGLWTVVMAPRTAYGEYVCSIHGDGWIIADIFTKKADANLIVTSVNEREKLLALNKEMLAALKAAEKAVFAASKHLSVNPAEGTTEFAALAQVCDALDCIRPAIEKVEGRS